MDSVAWIKIHTPQHYIFTFKSVIYDISYVNNITFRSKRLRRGATEVDWRVKCRDLLDVIWQSNDSAPFREPVDLIEHPGML